MIRPSYRLIDHTADMAYEVEGASFEHLLETATAALADIVLDCEHALTFQPLLVFDPQVKPRHVYLGLLVHALYVIFYELDLSRLCDIHFVDDDDVRHL